MFVCHIPLWGWARSVYTVNPAPLHPDTRGTETLQPKQFLPELPTHTTQPYITVSNARELNHALIWSKIKLV